MRKYRVFPSVLLNLIIYFLNTRQNLKVNLRVLKFSKKRISLLQQEIANFFQLWYLLGGKKHSWYIFFFNASSVLKLFPYYFFLIFV